MTETRESWVTLTKVFALLLVIMVHATPRDAFSGPLTGFVMPAFFILYGLTHNSSKYRDNLKKYFVNRAKSLMIPYFSLNILIFIMYLILYPMVDYGFPPINYVFWFIYGNGPLERTTHLWFLRTMFFAIILFSLIERYLHNRSVLFRFAIIGLTPGIGVLLKYSTGVELVPWGIDAVLISLSFMLIGYEIRRHRNITTWSVNRYIDFIGVTISIVAYFYFSNLNGFVNIGKSYYGTFIYYYIITGVLGTYAVGVISYYLCRRIVSLVKYAEAFNNAGQEIYEIHPLIIETNVALFGDIALAGTSYVWPRAPLFIVNFPLAVILSYLIATRLIRKSRILQLIFLGVSTPLDSPSFPDAASKDYDITQDSTTVEDE